MELSFNLVLIFFKYAGDIYTINVIFFSVDFSISLANENKLLMIDDEKVRPLCKRCSNLKFFLFVFLRIWTEYGVYQLISVFSRYTGKYRRVKFPNPNIFSRNGFLQFLILENFQRLKFLKVKVLVQQNKYITNVPYRKYHISHGLITY